MYFLKVKLIKLAVIQKRVPEFQTTCGFNNSANSSVCPRQIDLFIYFYSNQY